MYVLCTGMSCTTYMNDAYGGQKRVLEFPELEFIDAYVSPYWHWGSNLNPLEEQQGFLTSDPFF